MFSVAYIHKSQDVTGRNLVNFKKNDDYCVRLMLYLIGKNGVDCYSKNGHAVTVLTRQS